MKSDKKYHYDEQEGVFVFEDEISINWLLSQVLNKPELQITKVSNTEIQDFLALLSTSDLRMPSGQHSLFWLKQQLKEKSEMAEGQKGETWHQLVIRYRYILECLDQVLATMSDIHAKMDIKIEQPKFANREPNNMQAYFEPLE
ncbi:MAG: hypothetical protein PHF86_07825 [Candidatus Nanoarchaeia archaeon]|jgi:hypothetical protein|nr:hypothetical protein [Candidatus Nanoarchaeia archaeon]